MQHPNPLNPDLYKQMSKTFGHVKVANPGYPLTGVYGPRETRKGLRLIITEYGETYCANCPFCTDTRQRMYVNHRFGVLDRKTGRRHLELVTCFNENCFSHDYECRKKLHATLYPEGRYADEMPGLPVKPVASPTATRKAGPPPKSVRLDRLAPDHPARLFVERRGLDPDVLAAEFGVGYTAGDDTTSPALYKPCLVIPVWSPGVLINSATGVADDDLVGWQARLLEPRAGESKYMTATGMQTGRVLYNLPQASKAEGPLVVVEGVSDVWAVGTNAVALFGKTIQPLKACKIAEHARGRPVVVWLDADAYAAANGVAEKITRARRSVGDLSPVVIARCPDGRGDPGECSREEVAAAINLALNP